MPIATEHALSTSKGTGTTIRISWGLVQIPAKLYVLSDAKRSVPSRSRFTADGHPLGNRAYDKVTLENYEGDVVTKAPVGDKWVELADAEIEGLATTVKGVAEIATFIPTSALDTCYVTEKVGAWCPDTIKIGSGAKATKIVDPGAAKATALLRAAMAERDVAALIYVPSKAGGQYVALCADGRACYLSFAESVRTIVDTAPEVELNAAEMALAAQLIDGIGTSTPVLTDVAGALLADFLVAKAETVEGQPGPVIVVPTPVAPTGPDLMEMLAASLAAAVPAPAKTAKAKKGAA